MEKSKRFAAPEAAIRLWFWLFAAAALIAAVCMPDRGQMFAGLGRLCVLPYQSANPYFAAENGGFAGTFLNVALVCAICAAVYSLPGSKPDGVSVLAFFLTAGFAFWGNRSLLASLAAGDIFAEAYAMPGSGAMRSDVVAVESCTVLLMDVERVLSRCTNSCAFHARLTENLFALLAEKNRILARKVDYLAQRTTRQRLLAYLSEQAQRAGSAEFTIPFNRQQLADFLSVERSAMSAELSRMQAEGLIETERSHFRLK